MKTSQAISILMDFQKVNSGKKTIKNYRLFLGKFQETFGDWEIREINSEHIFSFLIKILKDIDKQPNGSSTLSSKLFSISSVPAWMNISPILVILQS